MNTKSKHVVSAVLFAFLFTVIAVGNTTAATLHFAPGLYTGDLTIPASKTGLEVVGDPGAIIQGVATRPIVEWPQVSPNIEILADGVKLHGFTIKAPAYSSGNYSSGVVIGAQNVEVYSNAFQCWSANTSDEIGQAIQTYQETAMPGVNVSGLNVHDNTFTDLIAGTWGYEAIYINRDTAGGILVTVQDNTFSGNIFRAVTVERSNATINNNSIITDLAPTDATLSTAGAYEGISVRDAGFGGPVDQTGIIVTNNTINGSSASKGFLQGLRLGITGETFVASSVTATGNTISRNTVGVLVKDPVAPDVAASGIVLNNNNIMGNTTGVNNLDAGSSLDATLNYWGSYKGAGLSDGFRTGDSVSGTVSTGSFTLGQYGLDTDSDTTMNNADANDDNDGYADVKEVALGFDALSAASPVAPNDIYIDDDWFGFATGTVVTYTPPSGPPVTGLLIDYNAFPDGQPAVDAAPPTP
ncbi:hypothetical protein COU01_02685 [Candidatus Falkowbacteria bacterium CG10_big_fil_rev_8_21_14_0_10_44_15]|uniref:Right handed beta helix domain-containing protein n=1 Tax=Candidatus Falkowbacteria bacterium CG10_big_fil_rev_8_21_14_0_10_44_15 TaxID=1974569 RepID=A0A2H0UZG4_9BACT|nr:MAG: hypothetical protein COU01_02685 [Candidatus Falkowbacteria bacterium CG10_big_fil_rev_8_21_14_0_10_44_15]